MIPRSRPNVPPDRSAFPVTRSTRYGKWYSLTTRGSPFAGSIGRTDLPLSNPADMASSLARYTAALAPETVVHPGHGKPTTLGAERPHLEEWRARGW